MSKRLLALAGLGLLALAGCEVNTPGVTVGPTPAPPAASPPVVVTQPSPPVVVQPTPGPTVIRP